MEKKNKKNKNYYSSATGECIEKAIYLIGNYISIIPIRNALTLRTK
jgi:hypothetical protein